MPKAGQSLQDKFPNLVNEWNYERNNKLGIFPDKVACGSGKKVWWKCNKGHEWEAVIHTRTHGVGCPVCSNHKVLAGYNDLQTIYPDIAKEWNYSKNGNILPNDVVFSSAKKVWWKCKYGHEWRAQIYARTKNGTACPKCFISRQTSFPEQAIYYFLDMYFHDEIRNRYRLKDRDGIFEIDIYLSKLNIAIEYDGLYWHRNKQEIDLNKEFRIKAMGMKFIRIIEHNNNKIIDNCILYDCYKNYENNLSWAIQELFNFLGISDLLVDVSESRRKILELYHINEIENSLSVVNPKLAKEWNYEKNGDLKPTMFTCGSGEKVWWKCSVCGHEWQAVIGSRNKNIGCPNCANESRSKKMSLPKIGDSLQDMCPDLLKEWNYEKNGALKPNMFKCGSPRKVWWKCYLCGHEWETRISHRVNGHGCPKCGHENSSRIRSLLEKGQSLQDKYPNLIDEWDYKKNNEIRIYPNKVKCSSHKKVWWKCKFCGNEWQCRISNRSILGRGCPECAKLKRKKKKE